MWLLKTGDPLIQVATYIEKEAEISEAVYLLTRPRSNPFFPL